MFQKNPKSISLRSDIKCFKVSVKRVVDCFLPLSGRPGSWDKELKNRETKGPEEINQDSEGS